MTSRSSKFKSLSASQALSPRLSLGLGLSRRLWLLLVVMALIRFGLMFGTGPIHDEAYYWSWSQRPDFGYHDQPFLTGILLWPFVTILGDHAWVMRLVATLLTLLTSVFMALTWQGLRAPARSAGPSVEPSAGPAVSVSARDDRGLCVLMGTSPLLWGLGLLYVHDTVMMAMLFGGLWLGVEALKRAPGRPALAWWLGAGLALGLAFSAKTSAALWIAALGLALVLHRGGWRHLRSLGPWLTAALILANVGLFLLWNALHGWVTFAYMSSEHLSLSVSEGDTLWDRLGRLALLFLAMALLSGPTAVALVLRFGLRLRRTPALLGLALFLALPLALFAGLAWLREVYLNWISASCLGLLLLGALFWPEGKPQRWTLFAALPSALVSLALLVPLALKEPRFMLANARDMFGWERSIERLIDYRDAEYPGHSIAGNYYQLAAQVAFHQATILPSVGTEQRRHQFTLYADKDGLLRAPLLVLAGSLEQGLERLEPVFCHVRPVAPWPVHHRAQSIDEPYLFDVRRPKSLGACAED